MRAAHATSCDIVPSNEERGSGDLHRASRHSRKPSVMAPSGRFSLALRFGAMIALLCYQFAGASLALPAEARCARCAKLGAAGAVKPGASCPLSYHGHDCHNSRGKTAGHITVCPDGCLRHNGQGGEIPSLTKFLPVISAALPVWVPLGSTPQQARFSLLDPFLPQPYRPPSTPL